jgi:transposase
MSKEHRLDPQVQAGLLADPAGFPLKVHLFEGNKAETTTLIPVLRAFAQRHGVRDMVVVADAGMLSAANLNALEDAGFGFIVGSRITKLKLRRRVALKGDLICENTVLDLGNVARRI